MHQTDLTYILAPSGCPLCGCTHTNLIGPDPDLPELIRFRCLWCRIDYVRPKPRKEPTP